MSDALLIQANLREKVGTGPARSLRVAGYVPAVVYGKGEESKLIAISQREASILYRESQIKSAVVNMKIDDKSYNVFPKQFSLHPVTDVVEHVDFMFVSDKTTDLRMNIPVKLKGKERSIGIKKGGVMNIVFRALPCRVIKDKVPPYIEIDVSKMDVGITLRLKDIVLPEGVELLIKDLNQTFLRLTGKRKIVEEAKIKAPSAEAGEGEADKTSAEGDTKETATKEGAATEDGEKKATSSASGDTEKKENK